MDKLLYCRCELVELLELVFGASGDNNCVNYIQAKLHSSFTTSSWVQQMLVGGWGTSGKGKEDGHFVVVFMSKSG